MNLESIFYFFQLVWAVPSFVLSRGSSASNLDISQFRVRSAPDSPALPKNWAGRLPVPGALIGNDIFFWLFEAENAAYDDNLIGESFQRLEEL